MFVGAGDEQYRYARTAYGLQSLEPRPCRAQRRFDSRSIPMDRENLDAMSYYTRVCS